MRIPRYEMESNKRKGPQLMTISFDQLAIADLVIESGETSQEALKREIMEERETEVAVGEFIDTVEYDYPGFHLSMECLWCEIVNGDLVLKEHEAARWLTRKLLDDVKWLLADVTLIEKIRSTMGGMHT